MHFLIVDDHALFREGLRAMLQSLDPALAVTEADSCEAGLALDESSDFDLILLDHTLPGMNGVRGVRAFRQRYPTSPVLLVSASYAPALIDDALTAGARGFIPKSVSFAVMRDAIEQALLRQVVLAPSVNGQSAQPPVVLTPRQMDVLQLMRGGLTNKQIAQALGSSEYTVRSHVSAILQTLGVDTRTAAVTAARDKGLI
ncbi:response regulator transcription factor [Methyloversatilis thermotolerans]|uniref:response regulator transcription factor n=1 Tax=Methyloversatilis thermotolerans TaxID=1346290 RepID=UPI00036B4700|nr:response regulator transcription factor [Methyloversatilis thermotolerans]